MDELEKHFEYDVVPQNGTMTHNKQKVRYAISVSIKGFFIVTVLCTSEALEQAKESAKRQALEKVNRLEEWRLHYEKELRQD